MLQQSHCQLKKKDYWKETACYIIVGKDSIKVIGRIVSHIEIPRNPIENLYYSPSFSWLHMVIQRQ